jgi:hypothetical protein
VSREALPEKDTLEVRMAAERDAHEVVDLALLQVGALPDAAHGRHEGIVVRRASLEDERVVPGQRRQDVDDVEVLQPIDAEEAVEVLAVELGVVAQEAGDVGDALGLDGDGRFCGFDYGVRECGLDPLGDVRARDGDCRHRHSSACLRHA